MTNLITMNNMAGYEYNQKIINILSEKEGVNAYDVINEYIDTLNNKNTKDAYLRSINAFFAFHLNGAELNLEDLIIDPSDATKYVDFLNSQLEDDIIKSATYNKRIQGVKQFYEWLKKKTTSNKYRFELFAINPFSIVKQINEMVDCEGSDPLSDEDVLLMLSNPHGSSQHIKEKNLLLLELGIITGVRRNALMTATFDNIKKCDGVWYIELVDKNNKTIRQSINRQYDRLKKWYEEDLKLRKDNDKRIFNIHPTTANRIIKRWANELGISENKKITFHSLRTSTATLMYEYFDNNLSLVQMKMNHDSMANTKRYLDKEKKINKDGDDIIEAIQKKDDGLFEELIKLSKLELVNMIIDLKNRNEK